MASNHVRKRSFFLSDMGCIVSKKINLSSEQKYYSFNGYSDQEESKEQQENEEQSKRKTNNLNSESQNQLTIKA